MSDAKIRMFTVYGTCLKNRAFLLASAFLSARVFLLAHAFFMADTVLENIQILNNKIFGSFQIFKKRILLNFWGLVFIAGGKKIWFLSGFQFYLMCLILEMLKTNSKLLILLNKNTLKHHNCLKLCCLINFKKNVGILNRKAALLRSITLSRTEYQ